jgi:uncharacterized protein (TIGR02058 family)
MAAKRIILEMGIGNDLHGGDYTKAALRAVQDALHHSSLSFIRSLGLDIHAMQVEVTIGVQRPEQVDVEKVRASLPYGVVTAKVVKGGLDVPAEGPHDMAVIAAAAIAVRFEV